MVKPSNTVCECVRGSLLITWYCEINPPYRLHFPESPPKWRAVMCVRYIFFPLKTHNSVVAKLYMVPIHYRIISSFSNAFPSREPAMDSLTSANTNFCLDLFNKINDGNKTGNVFYSPLSISSALAMVYLGSRGNTAVQMSQV